MFCQSCGQQVLDEYLYCFQRGTKLDTTIPSVRLLLSAENVTEKEAIEAYFYSGFSYRVILLFLDKVAPKMLNGVSAGMTLVSCVE